MNEEKIQKLRQYYHSILGIKQLFESAKGILISDTQLIPLDSVLQQLNDDFPELLPIKFDKGTYFVESRSNKAYYDFLAIQSFIAIVIGSIQTSVELSSNSTPVTERRQFTFIKNPKLKDIIDRDYLEIQKSYISECWKSVIILCGGAIEAILTDVLLSCEEKSKAATNAPRNGDIARWSLSELITVAVELALVTSGVEKLSSPLREYRNLVHPGNELRNNLQFGQEEARIALEILNIVHRDLSK